ncbi:MAG: hypothetical protein ACOWWM_13730 [Desulfobacterales bacterium]
MKIFYTVRDVEDMHAAGVVEIETHDDVVLTDVAREKAISLGMRLKPAGGTVDRGKAPAVTRITAVQAGASTAGGGVPSNPPASAVSAPVSSQPGHGGDSTDLVRKVKSAVVARLGTDKYNDLLDRIIPQVISRLGK